MRKAARVAAVALVICFIALLAYGLASKGTSDRIDQALRDGRAVAAPSFDLELLQTGELPPRLARRLRPALADGRLSLAELRGTPVVFNMWASWCTSCRSEANPLENAWNTVGRRGMLFLGLDIQDLRSDAHEFLKEFDVTYPSVRESDRAVADSYGATGIPETFFIDGEGDVVGHVIGAVSAKQLAAGVAAAVSGRVAGVGSGGQRSKTR